MRRNHEPPRRQLGRSTVSLTTLSASTQAQPPVAATAIAAATPAGLSSRSNGINSGSGAGGTAGGAPKKAPVNGSRFVRGSPMSVMGRTRSSGAGNGSSNGDMHSAAAAGDTARVLEHLRSGGNMDVRDGRQWSLLHHASFHGRLTVVGALLDAGADKEARTAIELTPLCLACQNGHQEVAEELLRRGASVGGVIGGAEVDLAESEGGNGVGSNLCGGGRIGGRGGKTATLPTALFIAAREGHISLVELLLRRGGAIVSTLHEPDGKLAGEVFGKGVDEKARAEIRAIFAEARARARKEDVANRHAQQVDARVCENTHQAWGDGHHPSTSLPAPTITPATPLTLPSPTVSVGNGPRAVHASAPSETNRLPASALPPGVTTPPPRAPAVSLKRETLVLESNDERRSVSKRQAGRNVGQAGRDMSKDEEQVGDSSNKDHGDGAAGSVRQNDSGGNVRDAWSGSHDVDGDGSSGATSGGGNEGAVTITARRQRNTRRVGRAGENTVNKRANGNACNGPANGRATQATLPDTTPPTPGFGLAVEQPLPVATSPASRSSGTRSLTPSRRGFNSSVSTGMNVGAAGRTQLPLTSAGLPTPQEWQICVQQSGLPTPPRPSHEDGIRQQVSHALSPSATAASPSTPIGLSAEPLLAPVDEVVGDAGRSQGARNRRSRSVGGDHPKVEFAGAGARELWLKHPMPRSATAPPPAARSPARVPISPAGDACGSGSKGGGGGNGDCSEFEDKWGMAFSSLMDLRALHRSTSRSANGRHAAWLGWEEEKRALEETISELNMRLASKDHDIAELHIQLEERERDLRVMHGGDLEPLGLSELDELKQCLQAALGLVSAGRERAVYRILQQGGGGGGGCGGGGVGRGPGSDSPRPDPAARS